MSQDSVLKVLKKNNKWMTTKEITGKLGIAKSCVMSNLKKLEKQGEVIRKRVFVNYKQGEVWSAK